MYDIINVVHADRARHEDDPSKRIFAGAASVPILEHEGGPRETEQSRSTV